MKFKTMQSRAEWDVFVGDNDWGSWRGCHRFVGGWVGLLTQSGWVYTHPQCSRWGKGGFLLAQSRVRTQFSVLPVYFSHFVAQLSLVGGCLLKEGRVMSASAQAQYSTVHWCEPELLFYRLPPTRPESTPTTLWEASWPIRSTKSH